MGLTPKQERNGIPEMLPGVNTAVRDEGPMPGASVDASQSAAMSYSELGLSMFDGGDLDQQNMTVGEKSFGGGPT